MKFTKNKLNIFAVALLIAAAAIIANTLLMRITPGGTDRAASKLERIVRYRMEVLEQCVEKDFERIPEDMVIYRYYRDSLILWCNRFPTNNDNIGKRLFLQRISDPRASLESPLAAIGDSVCFCNIGPKWYIAKAYSNAEMKTIAALEILDTDSRYGSTAVNSKLKLPELFTVRDLSCEGGSAVWFRGRPIFKVVCESPQKRSESNTAMTWLAYLLVTLASFIFLFTYKNLKQYAISAGMVVAATLSMFFWGMSPDSYSGGSILSSLGAVIMINLLLFLLTHGLYLSRNIVKAKLILVFTVLAGIVVYSAFALKGIITDSTISTELYQIGNISNWTLAIYISFILLFSCLPMLLKLAGINSFKKSFMAAFSCAVALYLVVSTSALSFHKEQSRINLWANRLMIDRDIEMELKLREEEQNIAGDMIIGALSFIDNSAPSIRGRIADLYFPGLPSDYSLEVYVPSDGHDFSRRYNEVIRTGEQIADNSAFYFSETPDGLFRYSGLFLFSNAKFGLSRIIVELNPGTMRIIHGSERMFDPGSVNIPSGYNYARYKGKDLVFFNGSYPYSTSFSSGLYKKIYQDGEKTMQRGGYTHFINTAGDDAVIISRKTNGPASFSVSFIIIALAQLLILNLVFSESRRSYIRKKSNHYATRINILLSVSLSITMITIVTVSIYLVTRSKIGNITTIMSDKVASVQAMVQREAGPHISEEEICSPEFASRIRKISSDTDSDISIYSGDGRLLLTSYPAPFEVTLSQYRMDREAFEEIVSKNRRYFIQSKSIRWRNLYRIYAPIFGADKKTVAILSFPYSGEETYYLERDAIIHTVGMVSIFIIFLLLARVAGTRIINRIFLPLNKMSLKMESAGLDSLEPIKYDSDDEITGLVNAYNNMIETLMSHSRQMAQVERDRAWSEMARQVAHEIKNPLTPMKLQLQRIIRQKQKGDPAWQDNFDEMSKVILDHVDILTDTANEFSNFAKLYNEPHTQINLDALLKEEIAMFDNRDKLHFTYIGLNDTIISGPKPQLTRVFVNIINNAVQAVSDKEEGQILVTLRKGATPGYEISIEDNGDGVSEENQSKLFTPNFTTKNGGSGLGLAISRSILETCGASISYCRSFSLGGACFRINYPEEV